MNTADKNLQHLMDCIMIDTMGLRVPNVPNAKLSRAFSQISDGDDIAANTGWAKGSLKSESSKKGQSLRVSTVKSKSQLLVEGSNAIHYQGHNIVSSGDAVMTAYSMLDAVRQTYPLQLKDKMRPWEFMKGDGIEVTRIDIPFMLKTPAGVSVGAVVNALALAGIRSGLVTTLFPRETVYFDQHSQLQSLKAYDKAAEMTQAKHKFEFPPSENAASLQLLTKDAVRLEAVYRLKSLTRRFEGKVPLPSMLSPKVLARMLMELLEKYNLRGTLRSCLGRAELQKIRPVYRTTVALWQRGEEMTSFFGNDEGLLKSHRRIIKAEYGIDILLPHPGAVDVTMELGDVLRAENFLPVPAEIRADQSLFYARDMQTEWRNYCRQQGITSVSSVYLDPYKLDDDLPTANAEKLDS
ncbi:phage/plasmid replication protein, II/X family [Janthinobacterium sp. HLX7-2]|uniref:phage/plasmid replication protein, II/X family n=1 Tax=Janthinobacterium sp. HLX7-2 TaxID=1259331 RepID=UPI003F1FBC49